MDESTANVGRIATLMRTIVEEVSSSIWHPNGRFPGGWCDDCSRVLGILLREQGEDGFRRVTGRRGEHLEKSHVWLQRGDVIVDITADQFLGEDTTPVMVTTDHDWHDGWEQSSEELEEIDASRTEGKLYLAIKNAAAWRTLQIT
jgi:hypothetical protein